MSKDDSILVGTAGEHYVAFRLAQLGYIVALTRAGSPRVDILVSNKEGTRTLGLQVKTAEFAFRPATTRGVNRKPDRLEFTLGKNGATINEPNIFLVFVDLRGRNPNINPDVYIYPSKDIYEDWKDWIEKTKWIRHHTYVKDAEKYKNNWTLLAEKLD